MRQECASIGLHRNTRLSRVSEGAYSIRVPCSKEG
jgi:hypothetical protein